MDRWNELERIGKLRDNGLLSLEEFERQKSRILGSEVDGSKGLDSLGEASADGSRPANKPYWISRPPVMIGGGLIGAIVVGLAFAANIGSTLTKTGTTAWDKAGVGNPTSCIGHWSYAPSLGQAMDVNVSRQGSDGYKVIIQKIELNAASSGFVRSDDISMLENTVMKDGVLVNATLHDDSGEITLECREAGGRLKYHGRQIALQQVSTDLKNTIATKGWHWPQTTDTAAVAAPASEGRPQPLDASNTNGQGGGQPSWFTNHALFRRFDFAGYPAVRYTGPIVYPSFKGAQHVYAVYRTRIADAARTGPDFAGNIAVEGHGCGTDCIAYNFVNVQSGIVVSHEPYGGDGEEVMNDQLYYRPTSTLLFESFRLLKGGEPDSGEPLTSKCFYNVYHWSGFKLERLASDEKVVDNDASECP